MSKTSIPTKTLFMLWGKAAGRCQYDGCNEELYADSLTQRKLNISYVAHIVADEEGGPRGHPTLSRQLARDINNLMLLCDRHHRLIDKEAVEEHTVDRLLVMKRRHEERIRQLTAIQPDRKSHVVLFGANIGTAAALVNFEAARLAMVPTFYPAEPQPIELSIQNSLGTDDRTDYWLQQEKNLIDQVEHVLKRQLRLGTISHLSIFAIAPQPLLIRLGTLLTDIPSAVIYQKHRNPDSWDWLEEAEIHFITTTQVGNNKVVALNLSLSATIKNDRIDAVLGDDCTVYTLTHADPYNDFLRSKGQLEELKKWFRFLFNSIKAKHGQHTVLHVFPAMPVAAAVEFGRTWMPKADMQLAIYDQNNSKGGFVPTLNIH